MRIFRSQKPYGFEVQECPHKKLTKNKHFPSKNWHDWVSGTISEIFGLKISIWCRVRSPHTMNSLFFAPQVQHLSLCKIEVKILETHLKNHQASKIMKGPNNQEKNCWWDTWCVQLLITRKARLTQSVEWQFLNLLGLFFLQFDARRRLETKVKNVRGPRTEPGSTACNANHYTSHVFVQHAAIVQLGER